MATNSERKSIALIVAGMKKPKAPTPMDDEFTDEESDDDTDTSGEGLSTAAEEMIRAIKRGDVEGLVESLTSFVEQCHSKADTSDSEDDDY